jgi:RHH-type transcriptional regulator, proline utilization regulon repressor / proline dehydrogenase / delta 1-pyrroline-5-carboxylate dehydrogenase
MLSGRWSNSTRAREDAPAAGCANSARARRAALRAAMRRAMTILGGEFVVGRTIGEALARSARDPALACCSFDMLGEGARSAADARRYLAAYAAAIDALGARRGGADPRTRHAISIKLSALEPRYSPLQRRARARAADSRARWHSRAAPRRSGSA